jgi:hypothetical protein
MHTTMKIIGSLLLVTFLISSNGCMTNAAIKNATGTTAGGYTNDKGEFIHYDKPNPAYYALLPLTIPADIVTAPFQLIAVLWIDGGGGLPYMHDSM